MRSSTSKMAILAMSTFSLGGCATTPMLAMKVEPPSAPPKVLLGQFKGSVALVHGDPKSAEIEATDGSLTCNGKSENGQFSTDMRKNRITHNFALTCSNGLTGKLLLDITASPSSIDGVGVGTLSDGSRIKVIVGDHLKGELTW